MSFNYLTLSFVYSALQGVAIILSLLRFAIRLKIRRYWWEDVWAAIALAFAVTSIAVVFIFFGTYAHEVALVTAWIAAYTFTSLVWSVRMSLLYSIIRIISPSTPLHQISRGFVALFLLIWGVLIVLKTWWCASNMKFTLGRPMCFVPNFIVVLEVTTDCIADAILVVLPLRLLWRVKLPRRQRRMILSIFSSTSVLSIISLGHAITQVIDNPDAQEILADIESTASIVLCNLLVVVTYAYRIASRSPDGELPSDSESSSDDDFTTPLPRTLTTVDLNTPNTTSAATGLLSSSFLSSLPRSTA